MDVSKRPATINTNSPIITRTDTEIIPERIAPWEIAASLVVAGGLVIPVVAVLDEFSVVEGVWIVGTLRLVGTASI